MDFHMGLDGIRQVRKAFHFLKKCLSVHKKRRKRQMRKEKKWCGKSIQSFSSLGFSIPVKYENVRKKVVGASRLLEFLRNRYF